MAEVRRLLGGGSCGFVHKLYSLDPRPGPGALWTAAGCGPADGRADGRAEAADLSAGGDSRGIYTTTAPVTDVGVEGGVSKRDSGGSPTSDAARAPAAEGGPPWSWGAGGSRRIFGSRGSDSRRVSVRQFSGKGAKSEPPHKTRTGYYDILEVSPTATPTQIKTAYYRQSFVYHPDRNAGSDEARVRFFEISEAYAVLRDQALRRKYDRGQLSPSDLAAAAGRPGARSPAARPPGSRRPGAGAHLRGDAEDFDRFFKSHYSDQLQRERHLRSRKEERLKEERKAVFGEDMDRMKELCLGVMLLIAVGIMINLKLG